MNSATLGRVWLWALSVAVLVPRVSLLGRSIGADDLLGAGAAVLGICWIGANWRLLQTTLVRTLIVTWAVVFAWGIIASLLSVYDVLGLWILPTEYWQYVKRFGFFMAALLAVSSGWVNARDVWVILTMVLMVAFMFGLLQAIDFSLIGDLAALYARSDWLHTLATRDEGFRRIIGVAGHPTSWSGFAAYGFALALGVLLMRRRERGIGSFYSPVLWLLAAAALANVALSGSRVGLLSLLAIVLCAIAGLVAVGRASVGKIVALIAVILVPLLAALAFFETRMLFLAYRVLVLLDTQGGGRVDQMQAGLSLLDRPDALLVGVGNASQRTLAVGHGIEVEPIYLLVNYGLFGTSLRFLILLLIGLAGYRIARSADSDAAGLGFGAVLCVAASLALMTAYFFYQEITVGTTVWILFGATVGAYEHQFRTWSQAAR